MRFLRRFLLFFTLAFLLPIASHAGWWIWQTHAPDWRRADWASAKLLPAASIEPEATVHIFAARVGRWRGIFAHHSWIVVKEANASAYTRFDVVGWGTPVRVNGWAPDGRWFGHAPTVVADLRGDAAAALIPRIEAAVTSYQFRRAGDYKIWPGPNSNSFVAALLRAVPELGTALPPNAIGRDFRDGFYAGLTDSRTGVELNLAGYAGAKFGWVEGIEVNLLGLVVGLDLRRPAIKLPGFGRIGMDSLLTAARPPATAA